MTDDDEISLAELFAAIMRVRYWIAGGAIGVAVIGIVYSLLVTPLYTAKTTVVLVSSGGGGSLLSRLPTGIASLAAGMGLSSGGDDESKTYLAVLGSRELANKFIEQEHMLPDLFPKRWDEEAQAWRQGGGGLVHGITSLLSFGEDEANADPKPKPSPWRAYQKFNEIRTISDNSTTDGTVTISFETRDPESAAKWANSYVALGNKEIRNQVVKEATDALAYLKKRAEDTNVVGLKDTIYQLVEAHLEKITLANVRPDYAFRVIDRAVPPDVRSSPKRKLIVVLAFILGGMLGGFVGLVREAVRSK